MSYTIQTHNYSPIGQDSDKTRCPLSTTAHSAYPHWLKQICEHPPVALLSHACRYRISEPRPPRKHKCPTFTTDDAHDVSDARGWRVLRHVPKRHINHSEHQSYEFTTTSVAGPVVQVELRRLLSGGGHGGGASSVLAEWARNRREKFPGDCLACWNWRGCWHAALQF